MIEDSSLDWVPETYEEKGYLTVCKDSLVESLLHSPPLRDFLGSSPNDPVMEVLKTITAVYFDLLENNADWESGSGQVGWALEETSMNDVFGDYVQQFIHYAKLLTGRSNCHKSEWGIKVQFLTMWSVWSNQDYWGEWDSGEELDGIICHHDMKITKLKDAILQAANVLPAMPSDPLKVD